MVKRKKLWEHIFFLQLFGMACKLHVALNTDLRSVAFRLFNPRYFVSHPYFVVFKWWPMTEWNKFFFFFRS